MSGALPSGTGLGSADGHSGQTSCPDPSGAIPSAVERIIAEAKFRRRLTQTAFECNADDVRFWDAVIRFLEEMQ